MKILALDLPRTIQAFGGMNPLVEAVNKTGLTSSDSRKPLTRNAVQLWQHSEGKVPGGWTLVVLVALERKGLNPWQYLNWIDPDSPVHMEPEPAEEFESLFQVQAVKDARAKAARARANAKRREKRARDREEAPQKSPTLSEESPRV